MNSISAFQSGIAGVVAGQNTLNQSAADIAKHSEQSSTQLTKDLVNVGQSAVEAASASKVVTAVDKTVGSLIDIKV